MHWGKGGASGEVEWFSRGDHGVSLGVMSRDRHRPATMPSLVFGGVLIFVESLPNRSVSAARGPRLWLMLMVLLGLGHLSAVGQQEFGTIGGTILESWEGKPLGGVAVTLRGTTLATTTDSQGRFQLRDVPAGDHVLRFSRSGYAATVVTEVRVLPGQTSNVDGVLRPEFYEMEEYEVVAEDFGEQAEQLLMDRQESSSLLDAIGSDMFKNLAVGDAAQALSKVTGATVADGKYAVIRGLADRYTFTTMNGMELPSADPDRKAFQLDLLPAKFIETMNVYKTFTPDMSGGFAGGSIDIVTRSFPEEFLFEFRASTAYNTQSSLRDDFLVSDRGSTDWLGMDDGTRELPAALAATRPSGSQPLPPEVKSSFGSTQFAPVTKGSPTDLGMEILFGDTHKVLGRRLGYLAGISYKNEYRYYDDGLIRRYDQGGRVADIDKTVAQGVIDYQWGLLFNLSYELAEHHELKFNTLIVQSAQDKASRAVGQQGDATSVEDGTYLDQSQLSWTERSLMYYQLAGRHEVPEVEGIGLDWGAALSTTTQDDPDYRIFQFFADPRNSSYNPDLTASSPNAPTRYWRNLEEGSYSVRTDLTLPVPSYNAGDNFIKTGVALNVSEREYFQRGVSVVRNGPHPFLRTGDPNQWMAETNLAFINVRNFPVNLTYEGDQKIQAAYVMADWAVLDRLQVVGGVRFEATEITMDTFNLTQNRPLTPGRIDQNDWLPSLGAKYEVREDIEVRAAWSRTVVRPTYREIAEVPIYDVTQSRSYLGNPNLQVSASENFDLRASWYPRPSELVSLALFAKRIDRPIELSAIRTDNSQIRYENFDEADVFGVEAEFRFGLDRLWDPLESLTVGFNAAYIESEVPLTEVQKINRESYGEFSTTRPLYDQPAYILNANLTWENPGTGTTVTLSGGVVGESLVLVGLARPDEFVQPAPELNLFVRQRIGKHWDARFTAKNLLDPAYEVSQTWPDAGERVLQSYTRGITFGLSIGCEF